MSRLRVSIFAASWPLSPSPPAAQAHVTLNPRSVTANSFGRLDVRVPNERDDASTKTLVVYFPSGFYSASYKRVWGWTAKVSMRKLATPIPSADGDITEEVSKITWRANSKSDWIAPGPFEEFGLSMRIPTTVRTRPCTSPRARPTAAARSSTGTAPPAPPPPRRPSTWWRRRPAGRYAHTPLKSVTPKKNSTQHSSVNERPRDVQGQDADRDHHDHHASGATVPLKSSGLLSSNQAVVRAVPRSPLRRAPTRSAGAPAPVTATPRRAPGASRSALSSSQCGGGALGRPRRRHQRPRSRWARSASRRRRCSRRCSSGWRSRWPVRRPACVRRAELRRRAGGRRRHARRLPAVRRAAARCGTTGCRSRSSAPPRSG